MLVLASNCIFQSTGVLNATGCFQHLKTYDIPFNVIIYDDARFVLVTLLNGAVAEDNAKNIYCRIIKYFHDILQYLMSS